MKRAKHFAYLALVILSIMTISIPVLASAATMYGSCPTDEYINVRDAASSSGDRIYRLRNGEPVTTTGDTSNNYTEISSPIDGWVQTSWLSSSSPAWMNRYGSRTMNLASKDDMENFQTDLNKISGIDDISVDGYWGPETENAVRQLQAKAGISVDGIAGTYTKLWTYNLSH